MENRLNGFLRDGVEETVRNGSRMISADLSHRAKATVLMRSLRVIQGVAHLETPLAGMTRNFVRKTRSYELATQSQGKQRVQACAGISDSFYCFLFSVTP